MKKFMLGFLTAILLLSVTPSFASTIKEYILYKVDYKLVVDGKEYNDNELPVLNYKGTTYVPLKNISELLHVSTSWNAKLGQAEIKKNNSRTTTFLTNKDVKKTKYDGLDAVEYNGKVYVDLLKYQAKHKLTLGNEKDKYEDGTIKNAYYILIDYNSKNEIKIDAFDTNQYIRTPNGIYFNVSLLKNKD